MKVSVKRGLTERPIQERPPVYPVSLVFTDIYYRLPYISPRNFPEHARPSQNRVQLGFGTQGSDLI